MDVKDIKFKAKTLNANHIRYLRDMHQITMMKRIGYSIG